MQTNTSAKIQDDEIDFRLLGQRASRAVAYPFRLFTSHALTSSVFLVLAILMAIILKYTIPKTYTASFIIRPVDATERLHVKMLGDLQTLLKYKDYTSLAKELKTDSDSLKKLVSIQIRNASIKDPADSTNYTEIQLITTDYNQFIPVQNAILNYLEKIPYFLKIRMLQQKQIELELHEVEKDLVRLDSLKAAQLRDRRNQMLTGQNSLLLQDLVDPMTTYNVAIGRTDKKMNLLARSAFLDNFQLIKSCVVVRHPSFPPRILIMCLYLVPFFMLLCFFYLHIKTRRGTKSGTAA